MEMWLYKSRVLLILFICFFCASGCKDGGSASLNGAIQDIYPMKVGYHWFYKTTNYTTSGMIKSSELFDLLIRGNQSYQGSSGFLYSANGDTTKYAILYYSGSRDVYSVQNGGVPTLGLRYPMAVGETYVLVDTTYPGGSLNKAVLVFRGNNETITAPAGTFSCAHFDRIILGGTPANQDTNGITKEYYANGVGLVQKNSYGYDSNKKLYLNYSSVLQSYSLK